MTEQKRSIRRHRRRIKKTVIDSAARNAATLSDGCNPELVRGADFDGIFEIPIIKKPKKYVIPKNLVSLITEAFRNVDSERWKNGCKEYLSSDHKGTDACN